MCAHHSRDHEKLKLASLIEKLHGLLASSYIVADGIDEPGKFAHCQWQNESNEMKTLISSLRTVGCVVLLGTESSFTNDEAARKMRFVSNSFKHNPGSVLFVFFSSGIPDSVNVINIRNWCSDSQLLLAENVLEHTWDVDVQKLKLNISKKLANLDHIISGRTIDRKRHYLGQLLISEFFNSISGDEDKKSFIKIIITVCQFPAGSNPDNVDHLRNFLKFVHDYCTRFGNSDVLINFISEIKEFRDGQQDQVYKLHLLDKYIATCERCFIQKPEISKSIDYPTVSFETKVIIFVAELPPVYSSNLDNISNRRQVVHELDKHISSAYSPERPFEIAIVDGILSKLKNEIQNEKGQKLVLVVLGSNVDSSGSGKFYCRADETTDSKTLCDAQAFSSAIRACFPTGKSIEAVIFLVCNSVSFGNIVVQDGLAPFSICAKNGVYSDDAARFAQAVFKQVFKQKLPWDDAFKQLDEQMRKLWSLSSTGNVQWLYTVH